MRIGDSASVPAATPPAVPPPEQAPAAPCPRCGTARSGRFCESCGFDFDAGEALGAAPAAGTVPGGDRGGAAEDGTVHPWFDPLPTSVDPGPAAVGPAPASTPVSADPGPVSAYPGPVSAGPAPASADPGPAAGPVPASADPAPVSADPASTSGGPAPVPGGPAPAVGGPVIWTAVAASDRAYFDEVITAGGPDAAALTFPEYCPERRFRLAGPEMRIGRRSVSQGLEPEIDLTGPHLGAWTVITIRAS